MNLKYCFLGSLLMALCCIFHGVRCADFQSANEARPSIATSFLDRGWQGNKVFTDFDISTDNFPQNTSLKLTLANLFGPEPSMPCKVGEDSRLYWSHDGEQKSLARFRTNANIAGEPIKIKLESEDNKVKAQATFIPFPLTVSNEKGQKLEAVLQSIFGELYEINLTGYAPFETLTFTSSQYNEHLKTDIKTDAKGKLTFVMAPEVIGKNRGEARIRIATNEGGSLEIALPWDRNGLSPVKPKAS